MQMVTIANNINNTTGSNGKKLTVMTLSKKPCDKIAKKIDIEKMSH